MITNLFLYTEWTGTRPLDPSQKWLVWWAVCTAGSWERCPSPAVATHRAAAGGPLVAGTCAASDSRASTCSWQWVWETDSRTGWLYSEMINIKTDNKYQELYKKIWLQHFFIFKFRFTSFVFLQHDSKTGRNHASTRWSYLNCYNRLAATVVRASIRHLSHGHRRRLAGRELS